MPSRAPGPGRSRCLGPESGKPDPTGVSATVEGQQRTGRGNSAAFSFVTLGSRQVLVLDRVPIISSWGRLAMAVVFAGWVPTRPVLSANHELGDLLRWSAPSSGCGTWPGGIEEAE